MKRLLTVKVSLGKKSKTYTVTRTKSTNNNLGLLSATTGTWSQGFDPNVIYYTLTLEENTKSTTIRATAAAGKLASILQSSKKVSLNNGAYNDIKITVRAQSRARKTYIIHVQRAASTNQNLKSLSISPRGMTPAFNIGVTNYTLTLPASTKVAFGVSVSAKAAGYKTKVNVKERASRQRG